MQFSENLSLGGHRLGLILITLLVVPLLPVTTASQSKCGSLITFRQYEALLAQDQSTCFRDGCLDSLPATLMSSQCPQGLPCFVLWDILRNEWQRDWCASCPDDEACRIRGWPVLNATAACGTIPDSWLFGPNGQCCGLDDGPFLLSAWLGSLCNGTQWRAPFNHYGGMAKADWEEWIEPWNWTVRCHLATVICYD